MAGNVEFSEIGRAIMKNGPLVSHIVSRMGRLTKEECAAGEFIVFLQNGKDISYLSMKIGRRNETALNDIEEKMRQNGQTPMRDQLKNFSPELKNFRPCKS